MSGSPVNKIMVSKRKNPYVFLDVSVDGDPAERMVFELFHDVVPKTTENFRALCTGEKGIGPTTGKPLHFKGSFFHRIIKGLMAQAGDFSKRDGSGGESIYGQKFEDESFKLTHDGSGFLSMANDGPDKNGSQFLITFKAAHHLDGKHVVFGKLVQGCETLKKIEHIGGSEKGKPECTVKIVNCGEHLEDKKKANKLKPNEASPNTDSLEVKRRGKHKKTSRDRRRKRRRRYYSSESDSSSDSETDSSEFESDSSSDSSSSSGISSSSDDRHKKRKRASRRGKHRHGRKRNKRREKRRRRRDKKSRRKSRRTSESSSDSESDSTSGSISDDEKVEARGCSPQKSRNSKSSAKNQSPLSKERVEVIPVQKNGEMTNVLQRGGDSPKENGKLRSNGTDTKSARNADKQPDVVDAHPSKTRSGSSPKRITSKSMSISPARRLSKSPSVSPKRRSSSRSPQRSGDRSPAGAPQQSRSISQSPARRSVSSRSPDRSASPSPVRIRAIRDTTRSPSLPGRSTSRSPARSLQRRSTSRSLIRPPRHSRGPAKSSRRSSSRSPVRTSRRSLSRSRSPIRRAPRRIPSRSRSPIRRAPRRSPSRSPGRVPPRRSISRSPVRSAGRNNRRRYSKSPVSPGNRGRSPIHNRGRSLSRSASPDGSPKRLRRGRGFSQKYSYARRYRTPSPDRSPIRPQRYGGRGDRDRYSTYRSYRSPPRRHRSPPRGRTPPRYRGRRSWSRSRSVSRSPIRNKGPGKANYSRSPTHSRSPVEIPSSRGGESLRPEKRRSVSRSMSRSKSASRSSGNTPSPKHGGKDVKSRSFSASPPAGKGLVSYGDGSPDSSLR